MFRLAKVPPLRDVGAAEVGTMAQWTPPVELSEQEETLCRQMKTHGKWYVFLRRVRHELFDPVTQATLEVLHSELPRGTPPVPAAQLAMAMLLQSYAKVSDEEAIRRANMDRAWPMVLGSEHAPFRKTTLVRARAAFQKHDLEKVVLRRTVAMAESRQGFDPKALRKLRLAVDSAPLQGAGRVEDTFNLLGRALRVLVNVLAVLLMMAPETLRQRAGLKLLGGPSIKAMLDVNWGDADARDQAFAQILEEGERLEAWATAQGRDWILSDPLVEQARAQYHRIEHQDVERDEAGGAHLIRGVAEDRQISIHDPEMRHGHKSRSVRIDGYKRYEAIDQDTGAVLEAVVLPANQPEAKGADKMLEEVKRHGTLQQTQIDRAFLPSDLVKETLETQGEVLCRPYGNSKSELFSKEDFRIDTQQGTVQCPAGNVVPLRSKNTRFPARLCQNCPLQPECVSEGTSGGRSVPIHPQEALLQKRKVLPQTHEGREKLRERTNVEHALAHLAFRQGPRARYIGTRKNDFDVRRAAAVANLFLAARKDAAA